jgi:hypothetical protein
MKKQQEIQEKREFIAWMVLKEKGELNPVEGAVANIASTKEDLVRMGPIKNEYKFCISSLQ